VEGATVEDALVIVSRLSLDGGWVGVRARGLATLPEEGRGRSEFMSQGARCWAAVVVDEGVDEGMGEGTEETTEGFSGLSLSTELKPRSPPPAFGSELLSAPPIVL